MISIRRSVPTALLPAAIFSVVPAALATFPLATTDHEADSALTGGLVATEDVNADGAPDIATFYRRTTDDLVRIFLNDTQGAMAATHEYPVPLGTRDIRFAHMNADALHDLVLCASDALTLTILPGNGDGTFGTPRTVATTVGAQYIDLADVDADGDLDVVVADTSDTNAEVFLNDGDANLASYLTRSVAPYYCDAAVFADFDNDGDPDLGLTAGGGGGPSGVDGLLAFFENLGGIDDAWLGFSATVTAAPGVGNTPVAARTAELDGNPGIDIAVANLFGDSITVLLNDGAGNYAAQTFASITQPSDVRFLDFDADADLDIVTASLSEIIVIENLGVGAFGPLQRFPVGGLVNGLAIADFDLDGLPDIAHDNWDRVFTIVRGLGADGFATIDRVPLTDPLGNGHVLDINNDTHNDLVHVSAFNDTLTVLPGNAMGTFPTAIAYPIPGAPDLLQLADVDGDAQPDAILKNGAVIQVMLNDGTGAFDPPFDITLTGNPGAYKFAVTDIDNDSDNDIVVATIESVSGPGGTYLYPYVIIVRNDGAGNFTPDTPINASSVFPGALVPGDFNDDGWSDIATASNVYGLRIYLNDGAGGLEPPVGFNPGSMNAGGIGAADIDADGDDDLIITASGPDGSMRVYRSNGDGTLAGPETYAGRGYVGEPVPTDLDMDGAIDLVYTCTRPSEARYALGVMMNRGDGTFDVYVTAGAEAGSVPAIGDVDHDGDRDIVQPAGSKIEIVINKSVLADLAPPPPPVCPGDIDGDDDTDVFDFADFLIAFGATLGDPNYNAGADLNADETIDVFDFTIFLIDFGCPE